MIRRSRVDSARRLKLLRVLESAVATTTLITIDIASEPHLYTHLYPLVAFHLYPLLFHLEDHPSKLARINYTEATS